MQHIQVLELSVKKKKKNENKVDVLSRKKREGVTKEGKKRNKRNAIITNEQVQIIEGKR